MVDTAFLNRLADGVSTFHHEQGNQHQYEYDEYEAQVLEPYEDLLAEAKSRGMHEIGKGDFRKVFYAGTAAHEDAVVKISLTDGTNQNHDEVHMWTKEFGDEMQDCVASLLGWGDDYRWVVQQKATNASPRHVSTVRENIEQAGWACSDLRTDNIGLVKGDPVLTDFGLVMKR